MPGSSALSLMPRSLSYSSAPNVRLNGIAWIRRQIPWSVLLIWGRLLVAKNILPIMLNSNQLPYNGRPLRTLPPVICFILASSGSLTGRADLEREPGLFRAWGLKIDGLRQNVILKRQKLNTSKPHPCAVLDVSCARNKTTHTRNLNTEIAYDWHWD